MDPKCLDCRAPHTGWLSLWGLTSTRGSSEGPLVLPGLPCHTGGTWSGQGRRDSSPYPHPQVTLFSPASHFRVPPKVTAATSPLARSSDLLSLPASAFAPQSWGTSRPGSPGMVACLPPALTRQPGFSPQHGACCAHWTLNGLFLLKECEREACPRAGPCAAGPTASLRGNLEKPRSHGSRFQSFIYK